MSSNYCLESMTVDINQVTGICETDADWQDKKNRIIT